MKTKTQTWPEVMAELIGRRLAVLDALLRGHVVDPKRWAEELRWLKYHRLAWWDADDELWRHRTIEQARALWEREGPSLHAATTADLAVLPAPSVPAQTAYIEPEPLRVHEATPRTVEMEELLR